MKTERKTGFWALGLLALGLILWACNLSEPPGSRNYISLSLPDSLQKFDSIRILILRPGAADTLDTLWHARVTDSASLSKLPTRSYDGGNADVVIEGYLGGVLLYHIKVEYRGPGTAPVTSPLPVADIRAPVLTLLGKDTMVVWQGSVFVDPGSTCIDDRDSTVYKYINPILGTENQGWYELSYRCSDVSGNRAEDKIRYVHVIQVPDSIPPVLTLLGKDTMVVWQGSVFVDPGSTCIDDQDSLPYNLPDLQVDTQVRGWYDVWYKCYDHTGNSADSKVRSVHVIRVPDSIPPVLTLRGTDSVTVLQNQSYADPGADCGDERDGALPVAMTGSVDTRVRGAYALTFRCADSAGNAAAERIRKVMVIRAPDTVKPVLSLLGRDSQSIYDGQIYADSGAVCTDARDGNLPVTLEGGVDPHARGTYTLSYHCLDSAGNAADTRIRRVSVGRAPDAVKPILSLRGKDSLTIYDGEAYADSGAVCTDARDGSLPVATSGSVDVRVRGTYSLSFHCADSAGNTADAVRRIKVARLPDAIEPIIALRGADSTVALQGQAYSDSGSECLDDRDGKMPVTVSGIVNPQVRGIQTLTFNCADSAGNSAVQKVRKVNVIRVPDPDKPVLTLKGLDSVGTYQGLPYADQGAACADARDGALPVAVTGTVDVQSRGAYSLKYACTDSAGNAAVEKVRKVQVLRLPDAVKPILTLRGTDPASVVKGQAYADAGADCVDDRDGNLPVTLKGSVNTAVAGDYTLTYSCADSAANKADDRTRLVKVLGPPDTDPPVITLAGPDTILVPQLANWDDPGAACQDARDGSLPVGRAGFVPDSGSAPGIYKAAYLCQDAAGNVSKAYRAVKAGLYAQHVDDEKETQIDILTTWNFGGTCGLGFTNYPEDSYFDFMKFDLSKVNKTGLKSAKLYFYTWGTGPQWPGNRADYTFRIYAAKTAWTEGTGNWYWHDGALSNSGEVRLEWYPVSAAVMAQSTDPALSTGITGANVSLSQPSNLTLLSTQKLNLHYDAANGVEFSINPPNKLIIVELDVTSYVKATTASQDKGFHIKVEGVPGGRYIGFMTKECGDGSYAPKLMLGY